MLEYAAKKVKRPDWRFERATPDYHINVADGTADVVCFFSVFTHLLHEASYAYLQEARRVLKPRGRIVFSFLEFQIPSHWAVFATNLRDLGRAHHHNQFMSRDGIAAWADHLDLDIVALHDGDKPHIPIPRPLVLEDGRRLEGMGNLGQSVCILARKQDAQSTPDQK